MKILGVTMARGGSKGVPRKNVRMVAGKPLIAWTIEEALQAKQLDRYIVSTDDEEIRDIALSMGVEVPFEEPHSDGSNPLAERILWVLDQFEAQGDYYPVVADIRATNALKTWQDIDACVSMLLTTGADVVCGVTRLEDHHPSRIKMKLSDNRLVDVWPEPPSGLRQDLRPPVFIRNGSIYVVRTEALREGIHFQGGDVRGYEMPIERSINVDTELDLLTTEAMLATRS